VHVQRDGRSSVFARRRIPVADLGDVASGDSAVVAGLHETKRARLAEERARSAEADAWLAGELVRVREVRARWKEELPQSAEERERLEPVRSARFLLATAVRLIPQSERARYLEEFRAELLDVPRGRRLWHALSVLRGVFVLRLRRWPKNAAGPRIRRPMLP